MEKTVNRFGFFASLINLISVAIYTLSFFLIAKNGDLFFWTNLPEYIKFNQSNDQTFKYLAMLFMIVYGIGYLIALLCVEQNISKEKHFFTKTGILFALGFLITIGINYFIQLTAVRLQLNEGVTKGLEQLIMSNPISGVAAINMLGWTVFYGISSLFISFVFSGKEQRFCKYSFFLNSVFMFLAFIAFTLQINQLLFFCMYIGLGGTMIGMSTALLLYFKRRLNNLK